jgi:hypothetical protein
LPNQSGYPLSSIPLRTKLETLRDPNCKKPRLSLKVLTYWKTTSSYLTHRSPVEVGRGVSFSRCRSFSALAAPRKNNACTYCPANRRRNLSEHRWLTFDERYRIEVHLRRQIPQLFRDGPVVRKIVSVQLEDVLVRIGVVQRRLKEPVCSPEQKVHGIVGDKTPHGTKICSIFWQPDLALAERF